MNAGNRWCLAAGMLALMPAILPSDAAGQVGREALRRAGVAYDEFLFDDVIRFASRGLDPAAGPRDTLWTAGLHRLVEALLEEGNETLAATWLKWAYRLQPAIPVDSNNFATNVTGAFATARATVAGDSLDRARVWQSWDWTLTDDPTASGALRIEPNQIAVNGQLEGGRSLQAGVDFPMPAGTYTVVASAADYLPTRATVEVLPGITTVLDFNLEPTPPGFLYVASRPWAEVYIDGEPVGYTTRAAHQLREGTHQLRILRQGYLPFDTTITVGMNERVRLGTITLRRQED